MRTVLSEEQVARRGAVGCGAVSQARDEEEDVRVARRDILGIGPREDVEVGIIGGYSVLSMLERAGWRGNLQQIGYVIVDGFLIFWYLFV